MSGPRSTGENLSYNPLGFENSLAHMELTQRTTRRENGTEAFTVPYTRIHTASWKQSTYQNKAGFWKSINQGLGIKNLSKNVKSMNRPRGDCPPNVTETEKQPSSQGSLPTWCYHNLNFGENLQANVRFWLKPKHKILALVSPEFIWMGDEGLLRQRPL